MTAANSRADKNVLQLYLCCTLGPNVSSKVHSRTLILRILLSQQRRRLTNSWSKIYWFFGSHFFKELESMVVWFWNVKNWNRRFFINSNNHTILKIIRKWNSSAQSCTHSVVQYGLIDTHLKIQEKTSPWIFNEDNGKSSSWKEDSRSIEGNQLKLLTFFCQLTIK